MQARVQFNFAQRWEDKLAKPQEQAAKKSKLILAGILSILILGSTGSIPWIFEYKLRSDLNNVNQGIAVLKDIDTQMQKASMLKTQLENKKQLLETIKKNSRDPVQLLDSLKQYLPAGTIVNSFALNADNSVNISLTVPSPVEAARLLVSLNSSGLFQSVDVQTLSLLDKAQTLSFALKLK
ncbi:MAG: fimbrial assembly protein [Desulfitobacterium hafniense]|nr:fimbrial assembly protein [Desulfitobacterium hafniense]